MIFEGIESCVINAGSSSGFFKPQRGIRQGCCVSLYLFLLVAEVMAVMTRRDSDIKGIQLSTGTVKLVQFADHSTFLLKDVFSLNPLMEVLKRFPGWSLGLKFWASGYFRTNPHRIIGIGTSTLSFTKSSPPVRPGTTESIRDVPFYSQKFKLWIQFHGTSPLTEGEVRREVIWNNRWITIKGKPILWPDWKKRDKYHRRPVEQRGGQITLS